MHKVELQLREQGLMGEDLEAALAQEQAMIDKARQQSSDPEASGFAKRIAYDPAADWQKVTSPILWIGGDFDILEDVPSSADRMAQLLGESGHTDHAEITFSGTNHAIFETSSRLPSAFFQMTDVTRHPPGYHALLISWIKSRFVGQEGRLCRRP